MLPGQDSEETLESVQDLVVSTRKGKAAGHMPVRRAAMSETEVILSRIIGE